jgi:hypothetical protein
MSTKTQLYDIMGVDFVRRKSKTLEIKEAYLRCGARAVT